MNLKEVATKLRKAADMLEELIGLNLNIRTKNENGKTAKKIKRLIKKRKNPWNNPKYRAKMFKHMEMMRKRKKALGK